MWVDSFLARSTQMLIDTSIAIFPSLLEKMWMLEVGVLFFFLFFFDCGIKKYFQNWNHAMFRASKNWASGVKIVGFEKLSGFSFGKRVAFDRNNLSIENMSQSVSCECDYLCRPISKLYVQVVHTTQYGNSLFTHSCIFKICIHACVRTGCSYVQTVRRNKISWAWWLIKIKPILRLLTFVLYTSLTVMHVGKWNFLRRAVYYSCLFTCPRTNWKFKTTVNQVISLFTTSLKTILWILFYSALFRGNFYFPSEEVSQRSVVYYSFARYINVTQLLRMNRKVKYIVTTATNCTKISIFHILSWNKKEFSPDRNKQY